MRHEGEVAVRRLGVVVMCLTLLLVLSGCGGGDEEEEPRNPAPEQPLALRADGIGSSDFGDAAASVLAEVEGELGPPDADTGLEAVATGTCEGTRVRSVDFGGLRLQFTDGETRYESVGVEHFFGWEYGGERGSRPPLATEEGLELGDAEDDLVARYGSGATVIPGSNGRPALYQIDTGGEAPIEAVLAADDAVTALSGGQACRIDEPRPPTTSQ